jgi:hypothetical protein
MVSPRLRSVSVSFDFEGGDANATAPHLHPLPLITSNPVAERN